MMFKFEIGEWAYFINSPKAVVSEIGCTPKNRIEEIVESRITKGKITEIIIVHTKASHHSLVSSVFPAPILPEIAICICFPSRQTVLFWLKKSCLAVLHRFILNGKYTNIF